MQQIFSSLQELEEKCIIHRHISPNAFIFCTVDNNEVPKMVDFRFCKQLVNGESAISITGSKNYIAPEVLNKNYGTKSDMWSIGVVLYLLLSGELPFKFISMPKLYQAICIGTINFSSPIWDTISLEAKDLITKLICVDPNNRYSPAEALSHPWTQQVQISLPPRESAAEFIANLGSFRAKEMLKKNIIRFIGILFTTKLERDELFSLFYSLDTNKNGHLSREELKAGFIKLFGNRIRNIDAEVNRIIEEVDFNHSGDISYNEFITAAIKREKLLNYKRLENVFNSFDNDHNGFIDANELRDSCSRFMSVDSTDIEAMIKEWDLNGDGVIDLGEFTKLMLKI